MKKFLSYLKPYRLIVLVTVALLFVQSFTDLKLPNYMSKIVDVGIQQSGMVHASPKEITQDAMDFVIAVLPKEQGERFQNGYSLSEGRYHLSDSAVREEKDLLMGETVWTLLNLVEGLPSQGEQTQALESMENLKPLTQYLSMLDESVKQAAYDNALTTEERMIMQSGNVLGQLFYKDAGYSLEKMQRDYIIVAGMKMMGITLVGALALIVITYLSAKMGAGFSRDLRKGVFERVQSFASEEFDTFSAASLVVRTTNDITHIQNLFTFGLRMVVSAPIMAIGGIIMIQEHKTDMSWIIVVTVAILMGLFVLIFSIVTPKFKKQQEYVDDLNRVIRENVNGMMVIRAFDNQDFESERFEKANSNHADTILFISRIMTLMMPLMMLIMNGTVLAILWFGAHRVSIGALQIGDMMAFMQYSMQIISSFLMIAMMFVFIPRAMVSIRRIVDVLDQEPSIKDKENTLSFKEEGTVEFKDVNFKYGDATGYVLEDISFKAEKGKTTAFIGSTGSGKSTLVKLILRFFDVTDGSILVNGIDVRDVKQKELRESIGYVPQKSMLLSGDVESNVTYGKDNMSEDDILRVLDIAQAKFVFESEEGINMPISQDATNVSGGQKQRLSIARALAKDSPILIFDDSFSALDFKTDRMLRERLNEELSDTTLLIVAQRINTIMDADQIIVLDEGKIVGVGTHQTLLKTCEAYLQIALSQLSEEELSYE